MSNLFGQVFAPRLGDRLCKGAPLGLLDGVCFMWWDLPRWQPRNDTPGSWEYTEAALKTLERSLALPSAACQEAALHGLGHHAFNSPDRVSEIIGRFLTCAAARQPELIGYAGAARRGMVQ